uniref:Uncharacterized protein n=1 Tax=Arundo donax TaxID=35708 RepID=A0A0A9ASL6_ARUDO
MIQKSKRLAARIPVATVEDSSELNSDYCPSNHPKLDAGNVNDQSNGMRNAGFTQVVDVSLSLGQIL